MKDDDDSSRDKYQSMIIMGYLTIFILFIFL